MSFPVLCPTQIWSLWSLVSLSPTALTTGVSCIGRILELGPGAVKLDPGQLVFFDTTVRARDEPYTIMLQGLFAAEQKLQTYWRNGAFAEKVLVPLENIHPIPEAMLERYGAAKLSEMNTTLVPYGGFLAGGLQAGGRVMIQPATGHFGAAGVAVAVAMGASAVLAVGRNKDVLSSLVEKFGPRVHPVVITGTQEDKEIYGALKPVDMTLNIYPAGSSVESIVHGLGALKSGGTLVFMGGVQDAVPLPYGQLMQRCITVKGQFMYPSSAVAKMIGMIEGGLLDLTAFEEKAFKLDDVLEAVEYSASKENRGWLSSTVLEP
jgi:alcohol dehydrogenase